MLNKRNFIHIPFFDIKLLIYPYKYYISLEKKSYHNLEKKNSLISIEDPEYPLTPPELLTLFLQSFQVYTTFSSLAP